MGSLLLELDGCVLQKGTTIEVTLERDRAQDDLAFSGSDIDAEELRIPRVVPGIVNIKVVATSPGGAVQLGRIENVEVKPHSVTRVAISMRPGDDGLDTSSGDETDGSEPHQTTDGPAGQTDATVELDTESASLSDGEWSIVDFPAEQDLLFLYAAGPNAVFAASATEVWLYDGAWNSSMLTHEAAGEISAFFGASERSVYAGMSKGAIRHYDGYSWNQLAEDFASDGVTITALWGADGGSLFAAVDTPIAQGELWKLSAGAWARIESLKHSIVDMWMPPGSEDDIWCSTNDGNVFHVLPSETSTWDLASAMNIRVSIWGVDGTSIWAATTEGKLWQYKPGSSWNDGAGKWPSGFSPLNDIVGVADHTALSVGAAGTVIRFDGETWKTEEPALSSTALRAVSMLPSGEAWTVGDAGTVLRYH